MRYRNPCGGRCMYPGGACSLCPDNEGPDPIDCDNCDGDGWTMCDEFKDGFCMANGEEYKEPCTEGCHEGDPLPKDAQGPGHQGCDNCKCTGKIEPSSDW